MVCTYCCYALKEVIVGNSKYLDNCSAFIDFKNEGNLVEYTIVDNGTIIDSRYSDIQKSRSTTSSSLIGTTNRYKRDKSF